jgi:hypothetical protein
MNDGASALFKMDVWIMRYRQTITRSLGHIWYIMKEKKPFDRIIYKNIHI